MICMISRTYFGIFGVLEHLQIEEEIIGESVARRQLDSRDVVGLDVAGGVGGHLEDGR